MEAFAAKGYEVLILTDPIDEVWADQVPAFDGHPLRSIAKGQVDLDDSADGDQDSDAGKAQREQDFATLLTWLTTSLSGQVKEVRLSSRLTTSAACIVGEAHDVTPTLEKMYRAMGQQIPPVKRILELNPAHPLIVALRTAHDAGAEESGLAETAELIYGSALLAEGATCPTRPASPDCSPTAWPTACNHNAARPRLAGPTPAGRPPFVHGTNSAVAGGLRT